MESKGLVALCGLCITITLGWSLTGLVEGGCVWHAYDGGIACGVPDGYELEFFVMFIAAFLTPLARTDDWRASLGISFGALVSIWITLSTGTTIWFLILAAIELAVVGTPWFLWSKMSKEVRPDAEPDPSEGHEQHSDPVSIQKPVTLDKGAGRVRVYSSDLFPPFLQTPDYATASGRAHVGVDKHRKTIILIEESVLHHRIGSVETMAAQLGYLLTAMSFPSVSLGIIPSGVPRRVQPLESYTIDVDQPVQVKLLTALATVRARSKARDKIRAFTELQKLAVHGAKARHLIAVAIDELE